MILISLLITGLFEVSFCSLTILAFLIFLESYPIHLLFHIYWCFIIFVCNMISYLKNLLCLSFSFFIQFYLIMSFFFLSLVRGLCNLMNLFKRPTFSFAKLLWFLIVICSLCVPVFTSSIPFFSGGSFCHYLLSPHRCVLSSYVFSLLISGCKATHFPLHAALSLPHKFFHMAYSFSSKYFAAVFTISSLVHRLLNIKCYFLVSIHTCFWVFYWLQVRKHHLCDVSPLEFTEVAFAPWFMVNENVLPIIKIMCIFCLLSTVIYVCD